jgi:hypothetical protein
MRTLLVYDADNGYAPEDVLRILSLTPGRHEVWVCGAGCHTAAGRLSVLARDIPRCAARHTDLRIVPPGENAADDVLVDGALRYWMRNPQDPLEIVAFTHDKGLIARLDAIAQVVMPDVMQSRSLHLDNPDINQQENQADKQGENQEENQPVNPIENQEENHHLIQEDKVMVKQKQNLSDPNKVFVQGREAFARLVLLRYGAKKSVSKVQVDRSNFCSLICQSCALDGTPKNVRSAVYGLFLQWLRQGGAVSAHQGKKSAVTINVEVLRKAGTGRSIHGISHSQND